MKRRKKNQKNESFRDTTRSEEDGEKKRLIITNQTMYNIFQHTMFQRTQKVVVCVE